MTTSNERWMEWQTNRDNRQLRAAVTEHLAVKAADMVDHAARAGQAAVLEDRADLAGASVNSSARRKFASSALRRWIWWTTSAPTYSRSSCRSAGRFSPGA